MKQCLLTVLITLSFSTIYAQTIMRQRSTTEGFSIGVFGQYERWVTDSDDFKELANSSNGIGGGLRIGYGFSQRIEVYLRSDYTALSNSFSTIIKTNITHLDLGLRFNFGSTTTRFRPFVELAASAVNAVVDPIPVYSSGRYQNYQLGLNGFGGNGGAGFNLFITPALALNLEVVQAFGAFSKSLDYGLSGGTTTNVANVLNNAPVIGTTRGSAGLTYYFRGRR